MIMDVINIEDLPNWRLKNPQVKSVLVKYSTGVSKLIFNYQDPKEVSVLRLGQYDCDGNLHFIDEEGTLHVCYADKRSFSKLKLTHIR
jgi:hypothetical protein